MSIQISAAWQSRTDSRSFIPVFFSFPDKSFLCVAESSLRLGPCLQAAEGQRVEVVSILPSWLPSMAGGGILHGPHTLWLMALMVVCILMEACWTETWMMCSCFLLFKPEDNVWSALLSLLTVDKSATPLHEDTIKLKHLVQVQIGSEVGQTFFWARNDLLDMLNLIFLSQRSNFIVQFNLF